MFAPSAIAAVVAVIVLLFQKASPESLGYASVNASKQSSGELRPLTGLLKTSQLSAERMHLPCKVHQPL